jgi:hypothetical protein
MRIFEIGDKVIALNTPMLPNCQPRIKGKIYTVTMIMNCQLCGVELLNVNNNPSWRPQGQLQCVCNHKMEHFGRGFTDAKHFAPIDDIDELILTCVEDENYEDADFFTKVRETLLIEINEN